MQSELICFENFQEHPSAQTVFDSVKRINIFERILAEVHAVPKASVIHLFKEINLVFLFASLLKLFSDCWFFRGLKLVVFDWRLHSAKRLPNA
jgi:hypothetical protein